MPSMGSRGILKHIDDPQITIVAVDTAAAGKTWVTEDDSGTDILRGVAAGKGLHYTGAVTGSGGDLTEFCSNSLMFAGQEGYSAVELLVQFSAVTSMAFNFGFNDDVLDGSNTLPVELSSAAWTKNAETFLGFSFDTDATNDELHCYWADSNVFGMANADSSVDGQTVRMKGMGLTASKWLYLKVEMQDRGSGNGVRATFLAIDHTGKHVEKVFNTSVDRGTALCYYFGHESRGDSGNVYLRHTNWEQTISNM